MKKKQYHKLNTLLRNALSKETKESWNEFLDECDKQDNLSVSNDLEEAAQTWAYSEYHQNNGSDCDSLYSGFKKGVKWYKQQLMKDAIEVTVRNLDFKSYGHCILNLHLVDKDKVKIIIVKEDDI